MEPLISVVIVNWNGAGFLDKCLGSIYSQGFSGLEVVFVDNGSTDGSVNFVRRNYPSAVIIENTANYGFARANNQGIERSTGEYVLTLNNDTALENGFFDALARSAAASGEETGMWAPKILSMDSPGVIDSVGGLLVYRDGLAKGRGRLEADGGQYDNINEIFVPSACAALYRKKMLDEVGGFDEAFFAYCEDTDLGLRARLAGWKAVSVPGAVVYHCYSGTGGRYTPFKAYLVERNRIWVAFKNLPFTMLAASVFYTKWRYFVQFYGVLTGKGAGGRFVEGFSKSKLFIILMKAYMHGFAALPAVLAKRRAIRKKRRISTAQFRALFKEHGISAAELVLKD